MKNLPSFCLLLDILDIPPGSIPYILFKLEEIKKEEAVSPRQHALKLISHKMCSPPFFTFLPKSIGILIISQRTILLYFVNIGASRGKRIAIVNIQ